MRKILFLHMMLLIAALSGCKSTPNIGQDQEFGGIILDVPIHGGEPVDKPRRAEIVESIDTIQLQGSAQESLIDHINEFRITDDLIFVSSSDVFNVFDRDGRHLRKIQRKGRGPGEYLELSAFDIDPEHRLLYILDRQSNLIIIYDFEGKFERRIQLDSWGVTEFAVLPGGHLLILDLMDNRAEHRGLYEADENGQPLRQLYAVAPEYDHIIYGSKFLIHISDSEIGCLGLEDNDLIYHFRNDSLVPIYKVKTDIVMPDYVMQGQRPVPPDEGYYKIQYWETPRFLGLTLVSEELFTMVLYDHKTGQQTNYYRDELMSGPNPDLDFAPSFSHCYKNKLIMSYDYSLTLQDKALKNLFPTLTEDSNPLLIIFNMKQ